MNGLSKVLSVIVTASVLMMAALSVIFLTSGSIGNFGKAINTESCVNTIKQQCAVRDPSTGKIEMPSECYTKTRSGKKQIVQSLDNKYISTGDKASCP